MCEKSNNNTDNVQDEVEQKDINVREIDPVMFYRNFRHCI